MNYIKPDLSVTEIVGLIRLALAFRTSPYHLMDWCSWGAVSRFGVQDYAPNFR